MLRNGWCGRGAVRRDHEKCPLDSSYLILRLHRRWLEIRFDIGYPKSKARRNIFRLFIGSVFGKTSNKKLYNCWSTITLPEIDSASLKSYRDPKRKFIFQPSIFKSKPLVSGRVHKQKSSFFFYSNDSQGCWKSPGGRSDPPTQGGGFIFPPSLFRLKNVCQVFATPWGGLKFFLQNKKIHFFLKIQKKIFRPSLWRNCCLFKVWF